MGEEEAGMESWCVVLLFGVYVSKVVITGGRYRCRSTGWCW